jgi:MoaA/NifB/PqqE/SkfB family radical SAM enzyme
MDIAKQVGFKSGSGLFFSLDFLKEKYSIGGCSHVKTLQAQKLIPQLVGKVPLLGINTVIHAGNLDELPDILAWITDLGGFMNVCPLIWGDWNQFIYRTADREFALKPEHYSHVEDIMAVLLEMKRQGYNLACSEDYITKLAQVCCCDNRFGWDCGSLDFCPILRIDSNLKLMVCSDLRGKRVSRFKLQDLVDPAQYAMYQQVWLDDEHRQYCCRHFGCYWSNIVLARDYFKKGGSFIG